jgi:hypothetical protein
MHGTTIKIISGCILLVLTLITFKHLPRTSESRHFALLSRTNQLHSYKEAAARICDNYTEQFNPLCGGQNADCVMVN